MCRTSCFLQWLIAGGLQGLKAELLWNTYAWDLAAVSSEEGNFLLGYKQWQHHRTERVTALWPATPQAPGLLITTCKELNASSQEHETHVDRRRIGWLTCDLVAFGGIQKTRLNRKLTVWVERAKPRYWEMSKKSRSSLSTRSTVWQFESLLTPPGTSPVTSVWTCTQIHRCPIQLITTMQ